MKKFLILIVIIIFIFPLTTLANSLAGRILIQVEKNGEAYYYHPDSLTLHYLGRPSDAFLIMRELGIGISNNDLLKIPVADTLALKNTFSQVDSDNDSYSDYLELINHYNPYGEGKLIYNLEFRQKNKGKIFLQVENNGEAWYVNPLDLKRYFLGRPADAFEIMRKLGLGISNEDLINLGLSKEEDDSYCPSLNNCIKYRGVEIAWELPSNAFDNFIDTSGYIATNFDLETNLSVIKGVLDKYPEGLLKRYLNRIYLMDKIYLNEIIIYGIMDLLSNRIFAISLEANPHLEYTIHHELAHILSLRPSTVWQALHMKKKFESVNQINYGDINLNNYFLINKLEPHLADLGFLTPYSTVNIEEDIAQMAAFMFDNNNSLLHADFWEAIDTYPKLRHKFNIMLNFYNEKNPIFTEEYFKKISNKKL